MKILQDILENSLEQVPKGDLFRFSNTNELYVKTAYRYAGKIKVVSIRTGEEEYYVPTRTVCPVKSILVKY